MSREAWEGRSAIGARKFKKGAKRLVDALAEKLAEKHGKKYSRDELSRVKAKIIKKAGELR